MKTKFLSSALLFSAGLSLAVSMPQAALAEESSCHDYPGHREVLNEGKSQVTSRPSRTNFNDYFFIEDFGRRSYPPTAKQRIESINSTHKNADLKWIREQIEEYSADFFNQRKYGECHEFLENVFQNLDESERTDYYDIIAICYLLKNQKSSMSKQSNYLEELIGLVDGTSKLCDYSKAQVGKVKEYVAKIAIAPPPPRDTYIDPEMTLRLGLLNVILGQKEIATKYKNKLLSDFRKKIFYLPKNLVDDPMREGLQNSIQNNPDRFFSESQADALRRGKELMIDGSVSLCTAIGTRDDLAEIAASWIKIMPQTPLSPSKQVELIGALPEQSKSEFSSEEFSLNCQDFSKIYEALKKRGWNDAASKFQNYFFLEGFENSKVPGVEQITRYYFSRGDAKTALEFYSKALKPISDLSKKNTTELELANQRISPLYADLVKYKVNASNPIAVKTKQIYIGVKHDYDVHKCLELAEELSTTGWKLFEQGDVKAAVKLYKSAVEIRIKNLPADSRILACTLKDAGRAAALDNDFAFADQCFKNAISIFSKNPVVHDDDFIVTLESYGSLLNKNNRYDEAQKIYAKLKAIR